MKKLLFLTLISLSSLAQNIVATVNGKVEGYIKENLRIFKGIPFAAPPIGEFRWKAPQPVKNWTGVKKCNSFSASPIQNKPAPFYCWSEEFIAKPEPLSEDCLYLNVWTTSKSTKEKQPVMVWIYGGGLSSGSANCDIYDGEEMAKKGVVFVSVNYRVGVLGFMAHPELTKESGYHASGNYGFLDQIAALKWVQKNIAAFGGDPSNVTILGQSAGAFSVNALIASPLAKGLFHKAIPQSGGLLSRMLSQNLTEAEKQGVKFMELAKANSIADLRKISADEMQRLSNDRNAGRFGVTYDNYVLPSDILAYFKAGKHNQVPIMTGWVTGDGGLMGNSNISLENYLKEVREKYADKAETFLSIFPATNDDEAKAMKAKQGLINFAGLPSHLLATLTNKPAYLYQFSHVPPDKPDFPNYGAFHTSEVPYALHTLHLWNRPWQQFDKDLENTMSSYWVNFAKTGNPNGAGLPEWKAYDKSSGNIMSLGDKIENQKGMFKKEFDFLEANIGGE
ncbi:MAG: carboxylesterase family protein [Bacteroidetes bacterium]|nr:carboxylesterase family protein [Bacteroidota bacterium]